jgi:Arc/MetJ family transcription regulator
LPGALKVKMRIRSAHFLPGAVLECVFFQKKIHIMRTNIVIDDKLMEEALSATGLKTKREAVELGLRTLLRLRQQEEIRKFRGKLQWDGDLDQMRTDR